MEMKLTQLVDNLPLEIKYDHRCAKDHMLVMSQLYYDGLVDHGTSEDTDSKRAAFDALMKGTGMVVNAFHNTDPMPSEVVDLIEPHASTIVEYGSKMEGKSRHLSGLDKEVSSTVNNIVSYLNKYKPKIDQIVPVFTGGLEPALLFNKKLGLPIESNIPLRYSWFSRCDREVVFPFDYKQEDVEGKNVLLVEDVISGGTSSRRVGKWVFDGKPNAVYLMHIIGGPSINPHVDDAVCGHFYMKKLMDNFYEFSPEEITQPSLEKLSRFDSYVSRIRRYIGGKGK